MKKIFLTSGIVVCMACPAFATASWTGATSGQQDNGCTEPNLGVYSGQTTMNAIWTPNYSTITLNKQTATEGYGSGDPDPTPIYGVNNDTTAVYNITAGNDDDDYTFTAVTSVSVPTGKTVTLTLAANKPSTAETGDNVANIPGTMPTDERDFKGFYSSAAADATQYINSSGTVLAAGKTAAGGLSAGGSDTWYAQYEQACFDEPTAPTLNGHTFLGWATSTANCTAGTYVSFVGDNSQAIQYCVDANATLYACWEAKTITPITWDVGAGTAGSTSGDTSCTYGGDVTLPSQPSRTGYTFSGWEIANSSSGDGNQPAGGSGMQTPGDLGGSGDGRNG